MPSRTLGDKILFKSSRYTEQDLIDFAANHKWQHQISIYGLDSGFKQVVFKCE